MKIGCQTITFRSEAVVRSLPEQLKAVAAAGFDGVEIASRTLNLADPGELGSLLKENGLELLALHVGSANFDPEAANHDVDLESLLKYGKALGAKYVPVSGMGKKGPEHLAQLMSQWGTRFAEYGMTLCFHNHGQEIRDDFAWLRAFCAATDPNVIGLVLDLGWTYRAGEEPVMGLRRFADRVKYIHLKDQAGDEWCELGQGQINLAAIVDEARRLGLTWLVSEQDQTKGDAAESVRINAQHLKSLVAKLA